MIQKFPFHCSPELENITLLVIPDGLETEFLVDRSSQLTLIEISTRKVLISAKSSNSM